MQGTGSTFPLSLYIRPASREHGGVQVEFDEMGAVVGVTSEGETAKAPVVVCDPSYLPNKV